MGLDLGDRGSKFSAKNGKEPPWQIVLHKYCAKNRISIFPGEMSKK
jgi:hypothetical protein